MQSFIKKNTCYQTEEKCASSEENLIDKDRKKDSEDRKKRRGKSSIAPQPEMAQ